MANKKFLKKEMQIVLNSRLWTDRIYMDDPEVIHIVDSYFYVPIKNNWILAYLPTSNQFFNYAYAKKIITLNGISNNIIQQIKKAWLTLKDAEEYLKLKYS